MDHQSSLFPDLNSPLVGKVKGERASMAYPFFALSKGRRMTPLLYQDSNVSIEIRPSSTASPPSMTRKSFSMSPP